MRFDAATGLQSNAWPTAAFEQSTNFIMGALAATSTEVIIGGNFPFYNSVRRLGLAKLNASDGSVLPFAPDIVSTRVPFNPNATQLPDGGAVVAGDFAEIDGVPFDGLARIKPDGALDSSWQPPQVKGGITQLRALGNYLYLSGRFVQIGSTARNGFARLNISDGSLDAGFQPPVFNGVPSYFASDGNDVFVVGAFTTVDGNARFCAAKLNGITGAYLPQWAPSFQYVSSTTSNNCAGFQRMEAAGQFVYFATPNTLVTLKVGSFNRRLARVSTSTGVVDGGWDPNPTGTTSVGRMFVYNDSLYLAGSFTSIGGLSTKNIARYSTSAAGLIDGAFTNNTDSLGSTCPSIGNIAAGPAGVYVSCVGGTTAQVSQRVRRFSLSNGALDTGWTPFTGTSSTTPFIAPLVQVLSSRDVMVYGGITKIGTMPRQAVAFLPATGRKTSLPILMYLLD